MRAPISPDAGEAVLEHPAGEELVSDLHDDGAPRAILAREALVVSAARAPRGRSPTGGGG